MTEENTPRSGPPARYRTIRGRNGGANTASAAVPAAQDTTPPEKSGNPMETPAEPVTARLERSRSRYRNRQPRPAEETTPELPAMPYQRSMDRMGEVMASPGFGGPMNTFQSSVIPLPATSEQISRIQRQSGGWDEPRRTSMHSSSGGSMIDRFQRTSLKSRDSNEVSIERMVLVEVGADSIELPICFDTDAALLKEALKRVRTEIRLHDVVCLVEKYNALGLERPIRTYERMKDVVNGWDEHTKNTILVVHGMQEEDLSKVPSDPPDHHSGWLYMSSKAGKWSKRYLVFNHGVLKYSKKESTKEKDYSVIVNMNSWDLYDISYNTAKKHLKIPKSYSFAIKTQEKARLFTEENPFVYYFSTNDKKAFDAWKAHLYGFRSYYLHHVKGLGNVAIQAAQELIMKPSRSSFQYQDTSRPLIESATTVDPVSNNLRRGNTIAKTTGRAPAMEADKAFKPEGLLGRTYTQRRNEMEARDLAARQIGPGPQSPHRRVNRASRDSSDFNGFNRPATGMNPPARHASTNHRAMPRPLLNFEDEQLPVRQRAATVQTRNFSSNNGPLISQIPSTNPFSDPPSPPNTSGSNHLSRNRSTRRPGTRGQHAVEEDPFIPGGLVNSIQRGHGTATQGHGVANGRDAVGADGRIVPLVDVQTRSAFAQGSLLERLERRGHVGPRGQRDEDSDY